MLKGCDRMVVATAGLCSVWFKISITVPPPRPDDRPFIGERFIVPIAIITSPGHTDKAVMGTPAVFIEIAVSVNINLTVAVKTALRPVYGISA